MKRRSFLQRIGSALFLPIIPKFKTEINPVKIGPTEIDPNNILDYIYKIKGDHGSHHKLELPFDEEFMRSEFVAVPYTEVHSAIMYDKKYVGTELEQRVIEILYKAYKSRVKDDILHCMALSALDRNIVFYGDEYKPANGEFYFHDSDLQDYMYRNLDLDPEITGKVYIVFKPSESFMLITPEYGKPTIINGQAYYENFKIIQQDGDNKKAHKTMLAVYGICISDSRNFRLYVDE